MELRCDFEEMLPRIKPGRLQQELLVKAAKVKGDAIPYRHRLHCRPWPRFLLLAAAGFTVRMFERDETIAALLEDGLSRAGNNPVVSGIAKKNVARTWRQPSVPRGTREIGRCTSRRDLP